jgi:Domain of unknown function (DUF4388)
VNDTGSAKLNASEHSLGEITRGVVFFASLDEAYNRLKNAGDDRSQAQALIVDLGVDGFSIPAQKILRFSALIGSALSLHGICLLLAQDQALVFQNFEQSEQLTMENYTPADSVFVTYPFVVETVRQSIPHYEYLDSASLASSFKQQLVKNSVPYYRNLRDSDSTLGLDAIELNVLQVVDGRRTIEEIRTIAAQNGLPGLQCDMVLLALERKRKIYPVFERVEFLSRCFRKRKSFRLGHYMVALRIVSKPQLVDLLERQESMGESGKKPLLGQLLVADGYLSEQALHLFLQDQSFTAGVQNPSGSNLIESQTTPALGRAMIGHLQTIEPQDLLQSLASARKSGRLFLESAKGVANIEFIDGSIVHASLNRLAGIDAVIDFLVLWRDGIFTFSAVAPEEGTRPSSKWPPLSKMLMDSALLIDQIEVFLKSMPDREETVLEKDPQFEARMGALFDNGALKFLDESAVTDHDKEEIQKLTSRVDGINSLKELTAGCQVYPAYKAYLALQLLVEGGVLISADNVLTRALREFQRQIQTSASTIGAANALKILQITHRITFENKILAGLFLFGPDLQLSLATKDFASQEFVISDLVLQLKRWEETYKAYLARL